MPQAELLLARSAVSRMLRCEMCVCVRVLEGVEANNTSTESRTTLLKSLNTGF